jgi:hypothetical protein
MKKSKFSEEQIAYVLRQVEGGAAPADVCRQNRRRESGLRFRPRTRSPKALASQSGGV